MDYTYEIAIWRVEWINLLYFLAKYEREQMINQNLTDISNLTTIRPFVIPFFPIFDRSYAIDSTSFSVNGHQCYQYDLSVFSISIYPNYVGFKHVFKHDYWFIGYCFYQKNLFFWKSISCRAGWMSKDEW